MADNLFEKLKKIPTATLAGKESSKNRLDDAHENEKIQQSENRTKLGCYAVKWVMCMATAVTVTVCILIIFYLYPIIQDQPKLESLLTSIFSGAKSFISDFQSPISVIATLIFGDKLKTEKKSQ